MARDWPFPRNATLDKSDRWLQEGDPSTGGIVALLQDVPLARSTLAELGDSDYDLADFLERYGNAIEERAREAALAQSTISPLARADLLALLRYFDQPNADYRQWPQWGLRALAMLSPIHVASGLLGTHPAILGAAVRSARPNKPWRWWRALGVAILSDLSANEIATEFDLTPRAVHKYATFLVGPLQATRKAA